MTVPFAPLDPRGTVLGDEVYQRLGQAIIDGTLLPGEQLRDHDLAQRMGVSRTPVREALQRLERTGMVEVVPHKYTRVSMPNDKTQSDLFEFVSYLMGIAVRMAVVRCDDDVLTEALEGVDAMIHASSQDDRDGLWEASVDFFTTVTRASENTAVLTFMREAEIAIRRNASAWRPFLECPLGRTAAYQEFREAIANRDGEGAEHKLREINGFA
ncbi:GntR family transcriptional regulator [Microbacterium sp. C7(2022)]|uniref:GntR family transcriptional regulator n=1 Tax=Microbacterium sp. C7(2022) TaxID=2992759 RepID=UPI00237B69BC|nr:GntR family transcriptional regulator [Microbacterium sp. C7(2022)]MDE0547577.1 GntR family transcriptional regulator [Microbacterium sp. C7(2022)]